MSNDVVNITIAVPANVLYNALKIILDHYTPSTIVEKSEEQKPEDETLRAFISELLNFCKTHEDFGTKEGQRLITLLHLCTDSKQMYNDFIYFLKTVRKYEYCYRLAIFGYIKNIIQDPAYDTYIEDDDDDTLYNIVNLLISKLNRGEVIYDDIKGDIKNNEVKSEEKDDDIDGIVQDYNAEKKKVPFNESQLNMLNMVNDDMFENILIKMGMNEESKKKAYKIRRDVREGNPLNMEEIYSFTQEYKQFLPESGFDLPALMEMFKPAKTEVKSDTKQPVKQEVKQEAPGLLAGIDMNSIINNLGPMINNFSNSMNGNNGRGGKRNRRGRR
jgi:hypothetical protein